MGNLVNILKDTEIEFKGWSINASKELNLTVYPPKSNLHFETVCGPTEEVKTYFPQIIDSSIRGLGFLKIFAEIFRSPKMPSKEYLYQNSITGLYIKNKELICIDSEDHPIYHFGLYYTKGIDIKELDKKLRKKIADNWGFK